MQRQLGCLGQSDGAVVRWYLRDDISDWAGTWNGWLQMLKTFGFPCRCGSAGKCHCCNDHLCARYWKHAPASCTGAASGRGGNLGGDEGDLPGQDRYAYTEPYDGTGDTLRRTPHHSWQTMCSATDGIEDRAAAGGEMLRLGTCSALCAETEVNGQRAAVMSSRVRPPKPR